MPGPPSVSAGSAGVRLAERLGGRREEIEGAILARARVIADPAHAIDPAYPDGLRAAASAALEYGLAGLGRDMNRTLPVPVAVIAQARLAARNGIGLDTVLRRYFAGNAVFGDALIEEAEREDLRPAELKRLLRTQAALFDRLIAAVGEEHAREAGRPNTVEQRRVEQVQRLLDGELADISELAYDTAGAHHLGLIAEGLGVATAIRGLASTFDHRLLLVQPSERVTWAWLGGRRPLDLARLAAHLAEDLPRAVSISFGEPARDLFGWRLTHRQAAAAFQVARRSRTPVICYADVPLLAAAIQDDLLSTSLRHLYLQPLAADHDRGGALRRTLTAYFAAERNVSSTAVALGVDRKTVTNRLRIAEERIGRPLNTNAVEIESALRLDELDAIPRSLDNLRILREAKSPNR